MSRLRIFAVSAVLLGGAGSLHALEVGSGLAALLAAPAAAAETEEDAAGAGGEAHDETLAEAETDILPAPEGDGPAAGNSFPEKIGASPDEYRILISLQERRRELEAWETDIETRAQLVAAAEQRVQERLAELKGVQAEIEALLDQVGEQEETRIGALVATYEKMKSKDAARILAGLDDPTAMLVVARMKETNLAAVLGAMPTDDATRITEMLAQRADLTAIVGDGLSGET